MLPRIYDAAIGDLLSFLVNQYKLIANATFTGDVHVQTEIDITGILPHPLDSQARHTSAAPPFRKQFQAAALSSRVIV
jgi:hypothetical protein